MNSMELYKYREYAFKEKFIDFRKFIFKCCNFIEAEEGCVLHVYDCQAKQPTIGIGTLTTNVKEYMPDWDGKRNITSTEACSLCEEYLIHVILPTITNFVNVKVTLNENQVIALSSLIYNVGSSCFSSSRCLGHLNEGDKEGFEKEFLTFWFANGVKSEALANRRIRELEKFNEPIK